MASLTKQQTELIRSFIVEKGISDPDLEADLLDHICSAIETHMTSGESFEKAYAEVKGSFGENELKRVQVKTQALIAGEEIFYPNIKQSAALLLFYILLLFLSGLINGPIQNGDPDFFNQYAVLMQSIQVCGSLLMVILIAKNKLKLRSFTKVDIFPLNAFSLYNFYIILFIVFLWGIWMEMVLSWMPLSEARQAQALLKTDYSPLSLLLFIGILWPVLSEVLFRGIILKGLLRKYTPLQAILCSSIFFSVSSMHPLNIPYLFLMGLFSGWLFYRTHSLLPSILAVIFAQLPGIVYIVWAKPQHYEQLLIWKNLIGNNTLYYSLSTVSFLLTVFLLWQLKKRFDKQQQVKLFSIE